MQGGYSFYLRFDPSSSHDHERYLNGQLSVMFGEIPPVPAEKVSNNLLTGIVPGKPVKFLVSLQKGRNWWIRHVLLYAEYCRHS